MEIFTGMPGIEKIWGKGATKSSVRLQEGFDVDVRVVPAASYGAALQYFTGSKEHNIKLRTVAIEKGLKLNEYGLFREKEMLRSSAEEDIYRHLGMAWIPPELREDQGEIAAARADKLPDLVELADIKGDLHCHSNWDGGKDSIMTLVEEARRRGYEYIGIADHTKVLRIENGLDEKKLLERNREIDGLNKKLSGFTILKGCEANIMADGSIDIADEVLAQMDFVIVGIHSQLRMKEEEMTRRIVTAMENPHVDILAHPTGRLVQRRDEYLVDMEALFRAAQQTGTVLEIDAFPDRLDLNAHNIRLAKENNVSMVIDTDTHSVEHMGYLYLGVAQARRGWAERKDIINTESAAGLLKRLKQGS
jgi:DNA polymerase (family 10)